MPFSLGIWDRLPVQTQKKILRISHPAWLGTLHRTSPVSSRWGFDRGTPIDRYYIYNFLTQHRSHIRGNVLEVGRLDYTVRLGSDVEECEVLDNNPSNSKATLIADLEKPLDIPSNQFDCLIFTQVFQYIFNLKPCLEELHRILRPGGVLLATLPCVSRIDTSYGVEKDCWRFTGSACQRLFGSVFGKENVLIESYGNVLSCITFLEGIAYEELSRRELDKKDPLYPLIIGVRTIKI